MRIGWRSLVLTLRYTLVGEVAPVTLLNSSLLAEALQQLVATTEDAEAIVAQLEAALVKDYPFVAGLTVCYGQQGPGGVEQQLVDGILRHGLDRAGNDLLNTVLSYLVDMRNCLMIHKLWRWQVTQAPPLTMGIVTGLSSMPENPEQFICMNTATSRRRSSYCCRQIFLLFLYNHFASKYILTSAYN